MRSGQDLPTAQEAAAIADEEARMSITEPIKSMRSRNPPEPVVRRHQSLPSPHPSAETSPTVQNPDPAHDNIAEEDELDATQGAIPQPLDVDTDDLINRDAGGLPPLEKRLGSPMSMSAAERGELSAPNTDNVPSRPFPNSSAPKQKTEEVSGALDHSAVVWSPDRPPKQKRQSTKGGCGCVIQ